MSHPHELDTSLLTDRAGGHMFEVLRVWVEHHGPAHIFINPALIRDPADFGRILATVVHDSARAYAEEWGLDGTAALNAIFQGMYGHLTDPEGSAKETRVRILGHE